MRLFGRQVGALVLSVLCLAPGPASAQLIDRVLAVVGGTVITQTDAEAALLFALVRPPAQGQDRLRATLDQLIPREVVLSEVNREASSDVDAASVDKRMAAIRARFASNAEYRAALDRTAMTEVRLRGIVTDDLRIEAYEQQRFGAVVQPSEGEVADYFARHRAELSEQGRPLTLEQAQPILRQRLESERRTAVLAEWVNRLRRRVDVVDVYFADSSRTRK
jgi:hypothetical protein